MSLKSEVFVIGEFARARFHCTKLIRILWFEASDAMLTYHSIYFFNYLGNLVNVNTIFDDLVRGSTIFFRWAKSIGVGEISKLTTGSYQLYPPLQLNPLEIIEKFFHFLNL